MTEGATLILSILFCVVIFCGEPDIHDAIIHNLMSTDEAIKND